VFSEGGTGDSPVPPGDPPGGMGVMFCCNEIVPLRFVSLAIPSGESPDGTGGSPVLPRLNAYRSLPLISQSLRQPCFNSCTSRFWLS